MSEVERIVVRDANPIAEAARREAARAPDLTPEKRARLRTLLTEAADQGEVIPNHELKVIKAEATMSTNNKLMYKIRVEVTNGPYKGRQVSTNIVAAHENPVALAIFFRQMNAIGIGKEFFAANPSDQQVTEALMGRKFRGPVRLASLEIPNE